ncbi:MAG: hypothetical protein ABEH43_03145 [Flavobacteriales bacterium]
MKNHYTKHFYSVLMIVFTFVVGGVFQNAVFGQCTPCENNVKTINVDLSDEIDTVWSTGEDRLNQCCGAPNNESCIKFNITFHNKTTEFSFDVIKNNGSSLNSGGAAMEYEINCGETHNLRDSVCASALNNPCLVYCKNGNDSNFDYQITAGTDVELSENKALRGSSCSDSIWATGFQESSITWTSVHPGSDGTYDSYLSCTSGCDSTNISPGSSPPDSVLFEVSGTATGCNSGTERDTIKAFFVDSLGVDIDPQSPAICDGQTGVGLEADTSGGAKPYTYSWSGPTSSNNVPATTQSVTADTAGTYDVKVEDTTDCQSATDTVEVVNLGAISADAGSDQTVCEDAPTVTLNGSFQEVDSAKWFGGGSVFNPNDTTMDAQYTPTAGEISAGSVDLYLRTLGNRGCEADTDTVTITINKLPTADAGPNDTVCEGVGYTLSSASIGGTASSGSWSTSGDGSFDNASNVNATYTPGSNDGSNGSVTLTLTTDDPSGPCGAVSSSMTLTVNPAPSASITPDPASVCVNEDLSLDGAPSGGSTPYSHSWTGDTGPLSATNVQAPTFNSSSSSNASLTYTVTDDSGCTASDNITVTVNSLPTADAGNDTSICYGDNVTLSASGGSSYSWSTGDNTQNTIVSPTDTSDYWVEATDGNSCSDTDTVIVRVPDSVDFSASTDSVSCN